MANWALGPGPRAQNTDKICLPGGPTDQLCFMKVIKGALLRRLYEGGLIKESLIRSPYSGGLSKEAGLNKEALLRRPCKGCLMEEALLRKPN